MSAVQRQAGSSHEPPERAAQHLEHEQGGVSLAQLVLCVPNREIVQDPGEEHSLCDAEEDALDEETLIALDDGCQGGNGTPDNGCKAEILISARKLGHNYSYSQSPGREMRVMIMLEGSWKGIYPTNLRHERLIAAHRENLVGSQDTDGGGELGIVHVEIFHDSVYLGGG